MSKSLQLVLGQVAHAGVIGLQGTTGQAVAQGGAQGVAHGSQPLCVFAWQPHVAEFCPHIGQALIGATVVGQLLQPETGHAAIALENEHVAIPTAIAAATVSFLIVIFTSLCLLEEYLNNKPLILKNLNLYTDYVF
jgi:hypothetical protein